MPSPVLVTSEDADDQEVIRKFLEKDDVLSVLVAFQVLQDAVRGPTDSGRGCKALARALEPCDIEFRLRCAELVTRVQINGTKVSTGRS